jgi:hypothetical protein
LLVGQEVILLVEPAVVAVAEVMPEIYRLVNYSYLEYFH